LINVEDLDDDELGLMIKFYTQFLGISKKEKQNKLHSPGE
jgi:hypothetical protein